MGFVQFKFCSCLGWRVVRHGLVVLGEFIFFPLLWGLFSIFFFGFFVRGCGGVVFCLVVFSFYYVLVVFWGCEYGGGVGSPILVDFCVHVRVALLMSERFFGLWGGCVLSLSVEGEANFLLFLFLMFWFFVLSGSVGCGGVGVVLLIFVFLCGVFYFSCFFGFMYYFLGVYVFVIGYRVPRVWSLFVGFGGVVVIGGFSGWFFVILVVFVVVVLGVFNFFFYEVWVVFFLIVCAWWLLLGIVFPFGFWRDCVVLVVCYFVRVLGVCWWLSVVFSLCLWVWCLDFVVLGGSFFFCWFRVFGCVVVWVVCVLFVLVYLFFFWVFLLGVCCGSIFLVSCCDCVVVGCCFCFGVGFVCCVSVLFAVVFLFFLFLF